MKRLNYLFVAMALCMGFFASCDDTKTYAELLQAEKDAISRFLDEQNIDAEYIDDDEIQTYFKDSNNFEEGSTRLEVGKWYHFEFGIYMKINSLGDTAKMYRNDLNNPNIVVRYDSCYNLLEYKNLSSPSTDNLNNFAAWTLTPWKKTFKNEPTSRYGVGIDFPVNFVGVGGEVSVIIPSKQNISEIAQAVIPLYYRNIMYKQDYQ